MNVPPTLRSRRRLLVGTAVFIGALILLIATEWGALVGLRTSRTPSSPSLAPAAEGNTNAVGVPVAAVAAPAAAGITGGPTPVRAFGAAPIPPPLPDGARSPLADHLNDPQGTAREDVAAVGEILANHLAVFRQLPIGTNAEITAALAGDNPRAHTPLPPDSRAINRAGELVDRWGTPYFFHQLSRELMEIRSAGPDRKHFNADDVVWPEAVATGPGGIAQVGQ